MSKPDPQRDRLLGPLIDRPVGLSALRERLERVSLVEAWRRAEAAVSGRVSVVLLYALEGALLGRP